MGERIFDLLEVIPEKANTYRELIFDAKNHEIHFWRIKPGDWIYPHTHPASDDIWYLVEGEGEYYIEVEKAVKLKKGYIALASPREVHGIHNIGDRDLIVFSVLSPLPVDIEEAPGFNYLL